MGKVMSLISTTIDGFADGKYTFVDAEFYEFTHQLMAKARTIAFGRNTFEQFQERWMQILHDDSKEDWQLKMAEALHYKKKIVFSSSLKDAKWHNSTIEQKLDTALIKGHKKKASGGLLTFGSINMVSQLVEKNLIDDYYFCVQPLIAGNGDHRLFDEMLPETSIPLKYISTAQLKSGVQIIHYQPLN